MGTTIRHQLLKSTMNRMDWFHKKLLRDETYNFTYYPFKFFQISWFGRVDLFFQPTPKKKDAGC